MHPSQITKWRGQRLEEAVSLFGNELRNDAAERQEGIGIGRQHVATLMKKMAIDPICRRTNTLKPTLEHTIYPYLLAELPIVRSNQV